MNGCEDVARSLYLELRAVGLELWVEENPEGGPLDYGIEFAGLYKVPGDRAEEVRERIKHNEERARTGAPRSPRPRHQGSPRGRQPPVLIRGHGV